MRGWINKLSNGFFTSWKKKYLVLENKKLKYYANEDCLLLEGCLDFDSINCFIKISKKSNPDTFKIKVLTGSDINDKKAYKVFKFKAANNKELQQWVDALNDHHRKS